MIRVASIVEGSGEVLSVPLLLRRIANEVEPSVEIIVEHPHRLPKSKLLKAGELERAVELAARRVGPDGGILILLDADEDPPCRTGPSLLERASRVRPDVRIAAVLPKSEFEAWFIAGVRSLAGHRTLLPGLECPNDPESIRGAKEWLSDRMGPSGYRPTLDQPAFIQVLDFELAGAASRSFRKLMKDVRWLLRLSEPA